MKTRSLLFVAFLSLAALAFGHEAKVIRLTGPVEVILPGQPAKPLAEGETVPEGATIKTGDGGEVYLETVPGAIATIKANSEVLVETLSVTKDAAGETTDQVSTVDLKKGNIVSTLNPRMKDVNHYSVKTPKGVAAARGTVYSVSVNATKGSTTVATLSGTVTINLGPGVPPLILPIGTASANGGATQAIADYIKANPGTNADALKADIVDAVKVVANNVTAKASAVDTSAEVIGTMAAVVSAAAAAVPDKVTEITKTAVAAVASSSSATGKGAESSAVQAVAEAATKAVPSAALDIAKAATAQVVETNVADAVKAAMTKLAPGATDAQKQDAVNKAVRAAVLESATTTRAIAVGVETGEGLTSKSTTAVSDLNKAVESALNDGAKTAAGTASQTTGVTVAPPTYTNVGDVTGRGGSSSVTTPKSTTVDANSPSPH